MDIIFKDNYFLSPQSLMVEKQTGFWRGEGWGVGRPGGGYHRGYLLHGALAVVHEQRILEH